MIKNVTLEQYKSGDNLTDGEQVRVVRGDAKELKTYFKKTDETNEAQ